MSACQHKKWARQICTPREMGSPLVIGRPEEHCPWCARDAGRKLADDMMSRLIAERDEADRYASVNAAKLARCETERDAACSARDDAKDDHFVTAQMFAKAAIERDEAKRRGVREFEVTQETIGKLDDARAALVMALPLLKQAGVLPGSERAIAVAAIEACLLK